MRLRFVLLLVIVSAAAVLVKMSQTDLSYQARLAEQLVADSAAPEGAVVLLGDSILEGLDATAVASGALNFGIGGDTSGGLLSRIGGYTSLAKAHAVFLEIGINDLLHVTGDDVVANYRRILAALPTQPRLYLIGILPIDDGAFAAAYGKLASNAEIARVNAAIRELCRGRANCIPLQPFGAGSLPAGYHSGDGLHLSEAGYRVLADALKAALAEP
ncbi:MAG TPA: GDSL-type esterase/lipase family protein [Stellaceae bacterium]|jgi:lysophospholipase L1-like esterase|nr:GDSL-type esterase/lipase family protein [Stellaceae bacterium]